MKNMSWWKISYFSYSECVDIPDYGLYKMDVIFDTASNSPCFLNAIAVEQHTGSLDNQYHSKASPFATYDDGLVGRLSLNSIVDF
ncbi:MAG: hypothetical protein GY865_02495 [candidate division Zixibacteria bacterium]|nr:hypothetical protein [candidate division Zixibacteria bacterium]